MSLSILPVFLLMAMMRIDFISCCSCEVRHPQTIFCSTDFALKGKVLDSRIRIETSFSNVGNPYQDADEIEETHTEYTEFRTEVIDVFKGNMIRDNIYKILSENKENCKLHLQNSTTYLITGYIRENTLYTNPCEWIEEIDRLTLFQKQQLETGYDNCNGKERYPALFVPCDNHKPTMITRCDCFKCTAPSEDTCVWYVGKKWDCRYRYSRCNSKGKWECHSSFHFAICQRSIMQLFCGSVNENLVSC